MLRHLRGLLPGQWPLLHKPSLIDPLAFSPILPCHQFSRLDLLEKFSVLYLHLPDLILSQTSEGFKSAAYHHSDSLVKAF